MNSFVYAVHQGNPGAMSIVHMAANESETWVFALMEYCNRTNIRGPDLWVKFKEFNKDTKKFLMHVNEVTKWDEAYDWEIPKSD